VLDVRGAVLALTIKLITTTHSGEPSSSVDAELLLQVFAVAAKVQTPQLLRPDATNRQTLLGFLQNL